MGKQWWSGAHKATVHSLGVVKGRAWRGYRWHSDRDLERIVRVTILWGPRCFSRAFTFVPTQCALSVWLRKKRTTKDDSNSLFHETCIVFITIIRHETGKTGQKCYGLYGDDLWIPVDANWNGSPHALTCLTKAMDAPTHERLFTIANNNLHYFLLWVHLKTDWISDWECQESIQVSLCGISD